jgi:hypothetical protein
MKWKSSGKGFYQESQLGAESIFAKTILVFKNPAMETIKNIPALTIVVVLIIVKD